MRNILSYDEIGVAISQQQIFVRVDIQRIIRIFGVSAKHLISSTHRSKFSSNHLEAMLEYRASKFAGRANADHPNARLSLKTSIVVMEDRRYE